MSPRDEGRRYNPEAPTYTSNEDRQRYENAHKAQQVQIINFFSPYYIISTICIK